MQIGEEQAVMPGGEFLQRLLPVLADLVNDLIALIPADGSRITNDEIRAALEREAGESISDEELREIKSQVVALGVPNKSL